MKTRNKRHTSWDPVHRWYSKSVGKKGHYYHQKMVLPGVLRLLDLRSHDSPTLLDAGCGQGVLSRQIPSQAAYLGVDLSPALIQEAKREGKGNPNAAFAVGDVTKGLAAQSIEIPKGGFSHAACVLALQNMDQPALAIQRISEVMRPGGRLVLVLNHPCFRIPRQTHWGVDSESRTRYRRVDRYLSPLNIPIQAHPSKGERSAVTWSFHYPLSTFMNGLAKAGFRLVEMEEWCSDKRSTGKMARMENQSRSEIPLFLAITAEF